jgi:hypothetical protein
LKHRAVYRKPNRRQALQSMSAALAAGFLSSIAPALPRVESSQDFAALRPQIKSLRDELAHYWRTWAIEGRLARRADKPGAQYVYAVDVAQLMWYFAQAGDLQPYLALRRFAAKNLVVDNRDEPFTQGFVLWRCRAGEKPDASGTTEALRLAKALWSGSAAFNRPADAELALVILEAYARHYTVDQGIWFIRNYYNFGSRSFATNSFIIDYDADFLRDVAEACKTRDPIRYEQLASLARESYGVLRRSVAPCGLLYDLLQPELKTMYFGMDVSAFSPNDVIQTTNTCATAATVVKGEPAIAQGVLRFFTSRLGRAYLHYYGRSGEPATQIPADASEYAALARLAALLDAPLAAARFIEQAMPFWQRIVARPDPADAWTASELLLCLQSLEGVGGRR